MLNPRGIIFHLDVGDRMRAAFIPDQKAVALGVVAAIFGFWVH